MHIYQINEYNHMHKRLWLKIFSFYNKIIPCTTMYDNQAIIEISFTQVPFNTVYWCIIINKYFLTRWDLKIGCVYWYTIKTSCNMTCIPYPCMCVIRRVNDEKQLQIKLSCNRQII